MAAVQTVKIRTVIVVQAPTILFKLIKSQICLFRCYILDKVTRVVILYNIVVVQSTIVAVVPLGALRLPG